MKGMRNSERWAGMIAIVTESLSCMTRKDQESLNVVPVLLECIIDGESYPDYFVTEESAVKPGSHSLPPSASAYRSVFARLLEEGYEVLCITISKKISSSYDNAIQAKNYLDSDKICVVNSNSVAGGLFLLAKRGYEEAQKGKSLSEVAASVNAYKKQLCVSFSMNEIVIIRSQRRISSNKHVGQPIMNQKPILTIVDGSIMQMDACAPGYKEIKSLLSVLIDPKNIVVHYAVKTNTVKEMISMLRERYVNAIIYERVITMALKVNLGSDIIGIIGD